MAWYKSSMKSGAEEGGRSGGWGLGLPGRPRMDRISFCISFFSRPLSRLKLEWTTASACWLHKERKSRSSRGRRSRVLGWRRGRWGLEVEVDLVCCWKTPPPPLLLLLMCCCFILLQRQEKLWETSESMAAGKSNSSPHLMISRTFLHSSVSRLDNHSVFYSLHFVPWLFVLLFERHRRQTQC